MTTPVRRWQLAGRLFDYRTIRRDFTLSESTTRRYIAKGVFPEPKYIGHRAVFLEDEVREALAKLLSDRPSGPPEAA